MLAIILIVPVSANGVRLTCLIGRDWRVVGNGVSFSIYFFWSVLFGLKTFVRSDADTREQLVMPFVCFWGRPWEGVAPCRWTVVLEL